MKPNKMRHMYIKKYILFINILFILVAFYGCGGDYLPEKYLYKARINKQKIDIKSASNEQIDNIISEFHIVTKKWPLSKKAAEAHFEIANLYVAKKEFINAKKELENIVINFSNNAELAADAKFAIGQLYEIEQDDIEKAINSYKELYDLYPLTKKGLYSPLYIAEFYKRNNDIERSNKAYEEAIKHYLRKIEEFGEIKLSAVLQNYIALTYASQGKWQKAVDNWEIIPQKYTQSLLVLPTLITLGEIYFVKLKERSKAIEKYNEVYEKYPLTRFALQSVIKLIQIYFYTDDYENTKKWCKILIERAKGNKELQAQGKTIIARTLEKEGKWDEAEKIYDEIMNSYSETATALRVPIFMALHYQTEEKSDEVQRIYENALNHYEKILQDKDSSLNVKQNAFDLTNIVYAKQENWEAIIKRMNKISESNDIDNYKRARALFVTGYIYQHKLNNNKKALEIYNKFLDLYKNHPFKKVVLEQMKEIRN